MDFTKTGDRKLSWAIFIAFLFISAGMFFYQRDVIQTAKQMQAAHGVPVQNGSIYGQKVTAVGSVGQVIGTRAITLAGSGELGDNLLVVSDKPLIPVGGGPGQPFFHPEDSVSIQGEVQMFRRVDVEKELGIQLSPQEFAKFEGKPFIYAHFIQSQ